MAVLSVLILKVFHKEETAVQDYWSEFYLSARSWQRETMNIAGKS